MSCSVVQRLPDDYPGLPFWQSVQEPLSDALAAEDEAYVRGCQAILTSEDRAYLEEPRAEYAFRASERHDSSKRSALSARAAPNSPAADFKASPSLPDTVHAHTVGVTVTHQPQAVSAAQNSPIRSGQALTGKAAAGQQQLCTSLPQALAWQAAPMRATLHRAHLDSSAMLPTSSSVLPAVHVPLPLGVAHLPGLAHTADPSSYSVGNLAQALQVAQIPASAHTQANGMVASLATQLAWLIIPSR